MAYRPYFKHGIEQIQELVAASCSDLKALKVIQYELGHRNRPKALALKAEVDDLVRRLYAGAEAPPSKPVSVPRPPQISLPEAPPAQPLQVIPDRVVVECANCKTPNFVSTIDGVMQHLSCSACKSLYEAQFKYGVMRTAFQAKPNTDSGKSAMNWVLFGMIVLVLVVLMAK